MCSLSLDSESRSEVIRYVLRNNISKKSYRRTGLGFYYISCSPLVIHEHYSPIVSVDPILRAGHVSLRSEAAFA